MPVDTYREKLDALLSAAPHPEWFRAALNGKRLDLEDWQERLLEDYRRATTPSEEEV